MKTKVIGHSIGRIGVLNVISERTFSDNRTRGRYQSARITER